MKQILIATICICFISTTCRAQAEYKFPSTIRPLITTQWGQNYPYNHFSPLSSKGTNRNRQPAGCGPIAMAQVINYYKYPAVSPDKEYRYEWGHMFKAADKKTSEYDIVAVSKLINDCGVAAFTDFGEKSSSTQLRNIMSALKREFGYTRYMSIFQRKRFDTPELDSIYRQLIFDELKAGRPIIYRGKKKDKDDSHIFLIDGCRGTKVHVNMGWGGKDNGYYTLDDLNGYSTEHFMLTGVTDSTFRPAITDITLTEAGTLDHVLTARQTLTTQHIVLHGHVSAFDIRHLRYMCTHGILSTIDLYDTDLTALADSAFSGANGLIHITLPRNLTHIGVASFRACYHLNTVAFNPCLERISNSAFIGCNGLISLDLPPTLTYIGSNAFNSCYTLFHVSLPYSVVAIGNYAFAHCRNLRPLRLPASNTRIGLNITLDSPKVHIIQ